MSRFHFDLPYYPQIVLMQYLANGQDGSLDKRASLDNLNSFQASALYLPRKHGAFNDQNLGLDPIRMPETSVAVHYVSAGREYLVQLMFLKAKENTYIW